MSKILTVQWRTTDRVFGIHAKNRIFSQDKAEVAKTCFKSLYDSFRQTRDDVQFVVLADGISDDLTRFYESYDDVEIIHYENDNMLDGAILKSIEHMRSVETEWVWCQEDDYLFTQQAGDLMMNAVKNNRNFFIGGRYANVVFYPCDYIDRYVRPSCAGKEYRIFHDGNMWWREINYTTFSYVMSKEHIRSDKKLWDEMMHRVQTQGFDRYLSEKIWSRPKTMVVSSIPSMSAHLDSKVQLPAMFDWQKLWDINKPEPALPVLKLK